MRTIPVFLILFAQLGCVNQQSEVDAVSDGGPVKISCDQREFDHLEVSEVGVDSSLLIGEFRDRNTLLGFKIPQGAWLHCDKRPPGAVQLQIRLYRGDTLQSSFFLLPELLFDLNTMRCCPYPEWHNLINGIEEINPIFRKSNPYAGILKRNSK